MELSMIDCGVRSLRDLSLRPGLVSINLHSNLLSRIENLTLLQNLVNLDLSSNQIKRIDGLHGLVSLRTLNLSCNSIASIENLDGLRGLTWLNLSYNKIHTVHGLSELWGSNYSLQTLFLHNNFISSLEEITYYLSGLKNLTHLTLTENKFVKTSDYRSAVFAIAKCLQSLDNKDKWQKPVRIETVKNSARDLYGLNVSIEEKKRPLIKSIDEMSKLEMIENKIHQMLSIRDAFKESESGTLTSSRSSSEGSDISSPRIPAKKQQESGKKGILKKTNGEEEKSAAMTELVDLTKAQLESYRLAQETNSKLVAELRSNLESLRAEKQTSFQQKEEQLKMKDTELKAKDEELRKMKEANEELAKEINNLRKESEVKKVEQPNLNNEQIKVILKK